MNLSLLVHQTENPADCFLFLNSRLKTHRYCITAIRIYVIVIVLLLYELMQYVHEDVSHSNSSGFKKKYKDVVHKVQGHCSLFGHLIFIVP